MFKEAGISDITHNHNLVFRNSTRSSRPIIVMMSSGNMYVTHYSAVYDKNTYIKCCSIEPYFTKLTWHVW